MAGPASLINFHCSSRRTGKKIRFLLGIGIISLPTWQTYQLLCTREDRERLHLPWLKIKSYFENGISAEGSCKIEGRIFLHDDYTKIDTLSHI